MRARPALLPLLLALAGSPALAQQPPGGPIHLPLPPGYVEEPEEPPEDPLPPPPHEFSIAPVDPLVAAPDAVDLLKACKEPTFTDCFRMWQPPPPPPEPEMDTARTSPSPPDPTLPRQPAQGGAVPPPANPAKEAAAAAADKATFDALSKALKDSGLDGKVLLTNPSTDGPTLKLESKPNKTSPKP